MYLYLLLLLPAVVLVLFVAVTELKCYFRCQYYKKQGIPVYYTPFMEGLVHRIVKSLNTSNHLLALADDYNTTKRNGKPAFVLCNFRRSCANFNIVDVKLAKEFFTKEVEVSKREMLVEFHMPKGFLGEFGNEGLDHRAIFTEFFRVGNLNKLVPQVRSILAEEISRLKNKVDGSLDFTDGSHNFVKQYMIRLVDTLLFGYGAEVPKSKSGLSFSEEIVKICEIIYSKRVAFNAWNALTRDFLNKYKLLQGSREICERSDYLKQKVIELIEKRTLQYQASQTTGTSTNVIDLMINHNLTCEPSRRLTLDQMVGDCNVFLLAGFDTTTTSVHSMIYNLGLRPDLQTKLREEIRSLKLNEVDTTLETLDKGVYLEKIVRETIRVHPPVALVFNREIMTDFKLGPYNIRKGDGVNFMIAPILWDQDIFESGLEFNVETINEANKRNWLPFSLGKRACLGQLMSQMELKVFASYIIDNFELKTLNDPKDVKFTISLTMKLSPCEVAFHPISQNK